MKSYDGKAILGYREADRLRPKPRRDSEKALDLLREVGYSRANARDVLHERD